MSDYTVDVSFSEELHRYFNFYEEVIPVSNFLNNDPCPYRLYLLFPNEIKVNKENEDIKYSYYAYGPAWDQ